MQQFQTYGDDQDVNSPVQRIIDGALGKVTILTQAATTANGIVPEGEAGFFGTTLYFTISGKTYSTPLTLV